MKEPPRSAVVYYTLNGNTRSIAEAIAAAVGADPIELKTRHNMRRLGVLGYVIGRLQAIFRVVPAIAPLDRPPGDYDLLFIGTPIWAGRLTPAVRALLQQFRIVDRKIALFCCSMGGGDRALEELEQLLVDNVILAKTQFIDGPAHASRENAARAAEWARSILAGW